MSSLGYLNIFVTNVEKHGHFLRLYGHLDHTAAKTVERLLQQQFEHWEAGNCMPESVHVDALCAARYTDGAYYRARVLAVDPGFATVVFIDFGNRDRLPLTDLRVPDHKDHSVIFRIPAQASSFILSGAIGTWSEAVIAEVMAKIGYEEVRGFVIKTIGDSINLLKVYHENRDYCDTLQSQGYANVVPQEYFEALLMTCLAAPAPTPVAVPGYPVHPVHPVHSVPVYPDQMAMWPMWQRMGAAHGAHGAAVPVLTVPSTLTTVPASGMIMTPSVVNSSPLRTVPSSLDMHKKSQAPTRFDVFHLDYNSEHKVFISHVEKGTFSFAVQLSSHQKELETLVAGINNPSNAFQRLKQPFMPGTPCLAKYSEDDSIYRAVITNAESDRCKVYFVDYGNTDAVKCQDLFEIPAEYTLLKAMAVQFTLAGLSNVHATEETRHLFYDLVLEKDALLRVLPPKCEAKQVGELFIDDTNVKELVNIEVLKKKPKTSKLELQNVQLPETGSKLKVVVAYVKSLNNFFVQMAANQNDLQAMMASIGQHCNGSAEPLQESDVQPGAACCALFEGDGQWYRALILNSNVQDLTVMYVDYGNEEKVTLTHLKCANPAIVGNLRAQAIPCALSGFEGQNDDQLASRFEDLTLEKTFVMHVVRLDKSVPQLIVRLFGSDGTDISQMLTNSSSARAVSEAPSQSGGSANGWGSSNVKETKAANQNGYGGNRDHSSFERIRSSGPDATATNGWDSSADSRGAKPTGRKDLTSNSRDSSADSRGPRQNGGRDFASNSSATDSRGARSTDHGGKSRDRLEGSSGSQHYQSKADPEAWGIGKRGERNIGHCDRTEVEGPGYGSEIPYRRQDGPIKRPQSKPENKSEATEVWGDATPVSSIGKLVVEMGSRKPVDIVFSTNPHDFYLHERPTDPKFDNLMDQIAELYNEGGDPLPVTRRTVGTVCVAKYSQDDSYYRAKILSLNDTGAEVTFLDYGNIEMVNFNDLRTIKPNLLDLSAQALHCKLMGVSQTNLSENKLAEFSALSESDSLEAEFVDICNDVYSIILRDSSSNTCVNMAFGATPQCLLAPMSVVQSIIERPSLPPGSTYDVLVSWFETPGRFYVQLKSAEAEFKSSMMELQSDYKSRTPLSSPSVGEAVVARFKGDNALYRGVIKIQKGDKFGVQYVDYGNKALLESSHIYGLLNKYSVFPAHAIPCQLKGVMPLGEKWVKSPDLTEYFNSGNFTLTFHEQPSQPEDLYVVSMTRNGGDVSAELITRNLASPAEPTRTDAANVPDVPQIAVAPESLGVDTSLLLGQLVPACVEYVEENTTYVTFEPQALSAIRADIMNYGSQKLLKLPSGQAIVGHPCLVLTHANEYRRAIVVNCKSTAGVMVKFMDHAGCEEISSDKIYSLPERLVHIPPMVFETTLTNVHLKLREHQNVILAIGDIKGGRLVGQLYDVSKPLSSPGGLLPMPILKRRMNVDVVHTCGSSVWLQPVSQADMVSQLLDDMFDSHEVGSEPLSSIELGQLCAAKSSDGNWYRAVIENKESNNVTVQYVDYGNSEVLSADKLKTLVEKFLSIPAQAVKATLPIVLQDPTLSDTIREMAIEKTFTSVFAKYDGKWLVELLYLEGEEEKMMSLYLVRTGRALSMENSPFPAIFAVPDVSLAIGSNLPAELSFIKSATEFYVHLQCQSTKLEKMQEDLQAVSHCMKPLAAVPEPGSRVMALYSEDSVWYRGQILPGGRVLFLDYGNDEEVNLAGMRSLPPTMEKENPVALKCALASPSNMMWSESVMDRLVPELESGSFTVVIQAIQDDTFTVDVINSTGCSVANALADEGFLKDKVTDVNLAVGSSLPAELSFIKSATEFYVHLQCQSTKLEKVQEDLQAACHSMKPLAAVPEPGRRVMALYSEDSVWYRGQVLPGGRVLFLDYGNDEEVNLASMKSLPPAMEAENLLALKCALAAPSNTKWSESVMDRLVPELESGSFTVVIQAIQDDTLTVDVINSTGCSVANALAKEGFLQDKMDGDESGEFVALRSPGAKSKALDATVVWAKSPAEFYIHLSTDESDIEKMTSDLSSAEQFPEISADELKPGLKCAALFDEDMVWYRAKVLETESHILVQFIDYGNQAVTTAIRVLPPQLQQVPPLALQCTLPTPNGGVWMESATEKFDQLIVAEERFQVELLSAVEPFIANLIHLGGSVFHELASMCGIEKPQVDEEIDALRTSLKSPSPSPPSDVFRSQSPTSGRGNTHGMSPVEYKQSISATDESEPATSGTPQRVILAGHSEIAVDGFLRVSDGSLASEMAAPIVDEPASVVMEADSCTPQNAMEESASETVTNAPNVPGSSIVCDPSESEALIEDEAANVCRRVDSTSQDVMEESVSEIITNVPNFLGSSIVCESSESEALIEGEAANAGKGADSCTSQDVMEESVSEIITNVLNVPGSSIVCEPSESEALIEGEAANPGKGADSCTSQDVMEESVFETITNVPNVPGSSIVCESFESVALIEDEAANVCKRVDSTSQDVMEESVSETITNVPHVPGSSIVCEAHESEALIAEAANVSGQFKQFFEADSCNNLSSEDNSQVNSTEKAVNLTSEECTENFCADTSSNFNDTVTTEMLCVEADDVSSDNLDESVLEVPINSESIDTVNLDDSVVILEKDIPIIVIDDDNNVTLDETLPTDDIPHESLDLNKTDEEELEHAISPADDSLENVEDELHCSGTVLSSIAEEVEVEDVGSLVSHTEATEVVVSLHTYANMHAMELDVDGVDQGQSYAKLSDFQFRKCVPGTKLYLFEDCEQHHLSVDINTTRDDSDNAVVDVV